MARTYIADVDSELIHREIREKPYTAFSIHLDAPPTLQAYIDSISFKQDNEGIDCSSFKLSQLPETEAGQSLPFTTIQAENDARPLWKVGDTHQIVKGDYLLEVPSTCLVEPSTLHVQMSYVYELESARTRQSKGQGILRALSRECTLSTSEMPIESYAQFINLIRTQPRECLYEFTRNYTALLGDLRGDSSAPSVVAVTSLVEPMLANQRRIISSVQIGPLGGSACTIEKVYARKKFPGEESDVALEWTLKDGYVTADAYDWLDPAHYDFVFHPKAGCEFKKLRQLKFTVRDRNSLPGQLFLEYPSDNDEGLAISLSAEPVTGQPADICGPLPRVPVEAKQEDLDEMLSDLVPECVYTFRKAWTTENVRNFRSLPDTDNINVAFTWETVDVALKTSGPSAGKHFISAIELNALSCADESVTLTLMDKLVSWDDFNKSNTKGKPLTGVIDSNGTYKVSLTEPESMIGGYVLEMPQECFKSSEKLLGPRWKFEVSSKTIGAKGGIEVTKGEIGKSIPKETMKNSKCGKPTTEVLTLNEFSNFLQAEDHENCKYTLTRQLTGSMQAANLRMGGTDQKIPDMRLALRLDSTDVFPGPLADKITVKASKLEITGASQCTRVHAVQYVKLEKWVSDETQKVATLKAELTEDGIISIKGIKDVQANPGADKNLNIVIRLSDKQGKDCLTMENVPKMTFNLTTEAVGGPIIPLEHPLLVDAHESDPDDVQRVGGHAGSKLPDCFTLRDEDIKDCIASVMKNRKDKHAKQRPRSDSEAEELDMESGGLSLGKLSLNRNLQEKLEEASLSGEKFTVTIEEKTVRKIKPILKAAGDKARKAGKAKLRKIDQIVKRL